MHSQKCVHLSKQRCRDRHTHTYIHTQSLPRSIGADTHRHLLDRFPSTWGRHPAIRLPPSLYQQEGALRCCCSSEPAQLDTKYCREPLSFTPAGRRGGKKNTAVQTELYQCCFVSYVFPGWAGAWKHLCICICRSTRIAHITKASTGHNATTHCTANLFERWLKHWNVQWITGKH